MKVILWKFQFNRSISDRFIAKYERSMLGNSAKKLNTDVHVCLGEPGQHTVCLHAGTSPIKTMRFLKAAGDSRHVSWTIIYKWHKWFKKERLLFWMTKELPIHPGSCTYIILSPEVALCKWVRFNICITINSDIQETKFRILFIQHLSNLK